MIRRALQQIRISTTGVARFANRYNRAARYGLDLVLWSRLLSSRRDPIPIDFAAPLLAAKGVTISPPVLHVAGPPGDVMHWDDGFASVYAALLLNLQSPNGLSSRRYAHPAPAFQGIYLWDSAFIAQIWKSWEMDVARDVNRAVVELRDGARLQHVVTDIAQSMFTQPPLVAWSVARLHDWRPDTAGEEYLEAVYEPLRAFNHWLYEHRALPNGLFAWAHPYESGIDNSPRFSSRDESLLLDTRQLAAPDFCTYMVLQNDSLGVLAEALGHPRAAARFADRADELRQRMNELLWDEEDGLYYDRHIATGHLVRTKTIAALLPLWAGVPTPRQAERLHHHIVDPDAFNTLLPLPSVARDDPAFAKDMWRGPVWVNLAYAVILGLKRYGFAATAADLAFRLCDGVYRTQANCRRLYEFYDPERYDTIELHRKQGNRWKRLTLGDKPCADFVGWTGLVNTLVIELLVGYQCEQGRAYIRPSFPPQASGLAFSLRLPGESLSIQVEVLTAEDYRVSVRSSHINVTAMLAAGDELDLSAAAPQLVVADS